VTIVAAQSVRAVLVVRALGAPHPAGGVSGRRRGQNRPVPVTVPVPVPLVLDPVDPGWLSVDLASDEQSWARGAIAARRRRWPGGPRLGRRRPHVRALQAVHRQACSAGAAQSWVLWRGWGQAAGGVLVVGDDRPPGTRLAHLAAELGALPGQLRPPQTSPVDVDGQGGIRVVRVTEQALAQTFVVPVPGSGTFAVLTSTWTGASIEQAPAAMHDVWALVTAGRWQV
jgi:hypothetical protein